MKYHFLVNGKEFKVEKKSDGYYFGNDRLIEFSSMKTVPNNYDMVHVETESHIWLDGIDYFISIEKESGANGQVSKNNGTLISPLNGMVSQINVSLGAKVNKGDLLLTIEAMKMLYPIYSPTDGMVVILDIKVGQAVKSRQVLIKIE